MAHRQRQTKQLSSNEYLDNEIIESEESRLYIILQVQFNEAITMGLELHTKRQTESTRQEGKQVDRQEDRQTDD